MVADGHVSPLLEGFFNQPAGFSHSSANSMEWATGMHRGRVDIQHLHLLTRLPLYCADSSFPFGMARSTDDVR